jgi:hypothetical protein
MIITEREALATWPGYFLIVEDEMENKPKVKRVPDGNLMIFLLGESWLEW